MRGVGDSAAELPQRQAGSGPGLVSTPVQEGEREAALGDLLEQITSLCQWLDAEIPGEKTTPALRERLDTLYQVMEQDLEPDPDPAGGQRIRQGVAKDRRISIEDKEMRHGRKSRSKRIDGFKRHIAKDLGSGLIRSCVLTPANQPEDEALQTLNDEIEHHETSIGELLIDRGYVSSPVVGILADRGAEVVCRPWRQTNRGLFTKLDFEIDLSAMTARCPAGVTVPACPGTTVCFPADTCAACQLRSQCTTAAPGKGRTLRIATDEALQQRLRSLSQSAEGRERLRQRMSVEHSLAHLAYRQGRRARYVGLRANLFDLRRACAIRNLEATQRAAA